eukprot:6460147-Amphidinium_carterae.1
MQYMRDLQVWDEVDESVALERGFRVIGTRWLDINKGDDLQPVYRSRLVCQETRRVSSIRGDDISAVFAATPPLEALRWVLSRTMTQLKGARGASTAAEQTTFVCIGTFARPPP